METTSPGVLLRVALAAGLVLPACAGTRRVRFAEPEGAAVRIGDERIARGIPFEEVLDAEEAHRVEVTFPEEVLLRIGFSAADLDRARAKRSYRILGVLVCPSSGASPSVLRLATEDLRAGLLEGGVVYGRDERPDEGLVLLFKGSAVGIGPEDPEIDVHVGNTRGKVETAAKVGTVATVIVVAFVVVVAALVAVIAAVSFG